MVFSHYGEYYDEIDSLYHSQIVIKDASAEILVNGVDRYTLHYRDENPYSYTCNYIPKAGDVIALTVKAQGFDDVSATATIERPQPVEIVNTQVIYKDNGDDGSIIMDNPLDHFGVDSVMLVTLRIDDPVEQHFLHIKRSFGLLVMCLLLMISYLLTTSSPNLSVIGRLGSAMFLTTTCSMVRIIPLQLRHANDMVTMLM